MFFSKYKTTLKYNSLQFCSSTYHHHSRIAIITNNHFPFYTHVYTLKGQYHSYIYQRSRSHYYFCTHTICCIHAKPSFALLLNGFCCFLLTVNETGIYSDIKWFDMIWKIMIYTSISISLTLIQYIVINIVHRFTT